MKGSPEDAAGRSGSGASAGRGTDGGHRLLLPNTTQVPNVILDSWMAFMTGAKIKVVLYVVRRTYGFGRTTDRISVGQMVDGIVKRDGTRLDSGTGLGRSTVISAVNELVKEGMLKKHPTKTSDGSDRAAEFSLNLSYEAPELALHMRKRKGHFVPKEMSKASGGQGVQESNSPVPKTGPCPSKDRTSGVRNADPQNQVDQNLDVGNQGSLIDRRAGENDCSEKPWRLLATAVNHVPDTALSGEAFRFADQLVALVDVRRDLAQRLAQLCIERGEADMLGRVALRVAETEPTYPWPALLTAVLNAREEEGGRR